MNRPDFSSVIIVPKTFLKQDIILLYNLLRNIKGLRGIKFLEKMGIILDQIQIYADFLSPSNCIPVFDEYQNLDQKYADLQRKHGIITDDDIMKNTAYQSELRKLNKKSESMIEEYKQDWKEYSAMLKEPFDVPGIELPRIPFDIIPENIPIELYMALHPLIDKK